MKLFTVIALAVATFGIFLSHSRSEGTSQVNPIEESSPENVTNVEGGDDMEDDFLSKEVLKNDKTNGEEEESDEDGDNDDDLSSVTTSENSEYTINEADKPRLFKRSPWRRVRVRFRRFRLRRAIRKVCRWAPLFPGSKTLKWTCTIHHLGR